MLDAVLDDRERERREYPPEQRSGVGKKRGWEGIDCSDDGMVSS